MTPAKSSSSSQTILFLGIGLALVLAGLIAVLTLSSNDSAPAKTTAAPAAVSPVATERESTAISGIHTPEPASKLATSSVEGTAPEGFVAKALETVDRMDRNHLLEKAGALAAAKSPEEAAAMLDQFKTRADRDAFLRGMAHVMSGNPSGALTFAKTLEPRDRQAALWALVTSWKQGEIMTSESRWGRDGNDMMVAFELTRGNNANPDLAALYAREMLTGRAQSEVLGQAAREVAKTNPSAALEFGKGLEGDDARRFAQSMARGWVENDPVGALGWAASLDEKTGNEVRSTILNEWAEKQPQDAVKYATNIADQGQRESAMRDVFSRVARENYDDAVALSKTLPASEQPKIMAAIDRASPSGIGVRFTVNDGKVMVNDLTPGGAAASSGALKPNDQIIAISGPDGALVPVQGKDYRNITDMVRGPRNSTVTIQVAGNDGTVRNVELNRQALSGGENRGGPDFGRGRR